MLDFKVSVNHLTYSGRSVNPLAFANLKVKDRKELKEKLTEKFIKKAFLPNRSKLLEVNWSSEKANSIAVYDKIEVRYLVTGKRKGITPINKLTFTFSLNSNSNLPTVRLNELKKNKRSG